MNTVLITGATSGIGEATAEIFAQNNYRIIITGRRMDRLESLRLKLEKNFKVQVIPLNFDVRSLEEVEKSLNSLPSEILENIDILVNNAGLAVGLSTIDEGVIDDWERMIDTNIKGLLYVTRVISPYMVKRKKGHIINIGSIAGKDTYKSGNVYCATKQAVDSLTKGMRADLLPHRIKVTGICPGKVETEFSLVRFKGDESRANQVYEGYPSLTAMDIADIIYFAATRPGHVCLNDIVVTPTDQANAFYQNL